MKIIDIDCDIDTVTVFTIMSNKYFTNCVAIAMSYNYIERFRLLGSIDEYKGNNKILGKEIVIDNEEKIRIICHDSCQRCGNPLC